MTDQPLLRQMELSGLVTDGTLRMRWDRDVLGPAVLSRGRRAPSAFMVCGLQSPKSQYEIFFSH